MYRTCHDSKKKTTWKQNDREQHWYLIIINSINIIDKKTQTSKSVRKIDTIILNENRTRKWKDKKNILIPHIWILECDKRNVRMCCYWFMTRLNTEKDLDLNLVDLDWNWMMLCNSLLKMKSKSALKYELYDLNLEGKYVPNSKTH